MRKKKKSQIGKILLSIVLVLLVLVCIAAIGYLVYSMKSNGSTSISLNESVSKDAVENTGSVISEQPAAEQASMEQTASEVAETTEPEDTTPVVQETPVSDGNQVSKEGYTASVTENTKIIDDTDILSENALLIDLSNNTVVVKKGTDDKIYPASMTKILTILVAAENITDFDDTYQFVPDDIAYCLNNHCSAAGFWDGEIVPVRDLFYGVILPSGAEAATGLAKYVSGTREAFMDLMNKKLDDLGLSDTAHFQNCAGIHHEEHYCTMMDMAMILKAAIENDFCREVLSTHVYTTTQTSQNPDGIVLSNWFLRKIEDKDCGGTVICAKTGYTFEAGFCAASYFVSDSGKPYICVTSNTYNDWRCIYDHVAMYKMYTE